MAATKQIRQSIPSSMFPNGRIVLGKKSTAESGVELEAFDNVDAALKAAEAWSSQGVESIYWAINEAGPGLKKSLTDAAIVRRWWLFIDVDPERPKGSQATEQQRQESAIVASWVKDFLASRDWPDPLEIDSGNGRHLFYPIDLPNDREAAAAVTAALGGLSRRFSIAGRLKIDSAVGNAGRWGRLPGFENRKAKPYRLCQILNSPDWLELGDMLGDQRPEVSPKQLNELAALTPAENCFAAMLAVDDGELADGSKRLLSLCRELVLFDIADGLGLELVHKVWELIPPATNWTNAQIKKRIRDAEKKSERGERLRDEIIFSTREAQFNRQVAESLTRHKGLFVSGGNFAEVSDSEGRLRPVSHIRLCEMVSEVARIVTLTNKRDKRKKVASRLLERNAKQIIENPNNRQGFREIKIVTTAPIYCCNSGEVFNGSGFDARTRIYSTYRGKLGPISQKPTRAEVAAAVATLKRLVKDFLFKSDVDFSAWLAMLLALIVKPSLDGFTPFFLVLGNRAGLGKSLLIRLAIAIAFGERLDRGSVMPSEDEEFRKLIFAKLLEKTPYCFFDNIENGSDVGGKVLDQLLTAKRFEDRILGFTKTGSAENNLVVMGSGNRLTLKKDSDTRRRLLPILLDWGRDGNPEDRGDIERPGDQLIDFALSQRDELLTAAVTLLKNGHAERPSVKAWGSFDQFAQVVAGAIIAAGLPDPLDNRKEADYLADYNSTSDEVEAALNWLYVTFGLGKEITAAAIASKLSLDFDQEQTESTEQKENREKVAGYLTPPGTRSAVKRIGKMLASELIHYPARVGRKDGKGQGLSVRLERHENKNSKTWFYQLKEAQGQK